MHATPSPEHSLILLLLVVLAWCGATDIGSRRIPNGLTFPTMLAGLLCHALAAGLPGLAFSLAGLGAGLGLILGFHILGLMGAGDAKLMAAVGSVLGPAGALTVFLFSAVFGGAWALGRVALRPGGVRQMLAQVRGDAGAAFLSGGRLSPAGGAAGRTSMPYAPAVAAGVVAALAWTGLGHDYFSFF